MSQFMQGEDVCPVIGHGKGLHLSRSFPRETFLFRAGGLFDPYPVPLGEGKDMVPIIHERKSAMENATIPSAEPTIMEKMPSIESIMHVLSVKITIHHSRTYGKHSFSKTAKKFFDDLANNNLTSRITMNHSQH